MTTSIKKLRSFALIENFISFLFKIALSVIVILFIAILSFIIILSTKPRVIPAVNNYVLKKVNEFPDVSANFNLSNATLYFGSDLRLQYEINDFHLQSSDVEFKLSKFIIDADFMKLIFGKINISHIVLNDSIFELNLAERGNKSEASSELGFIEKLQNIVAKISEKSFIINNFVLKDLDILVKVNERQSYINIINSKFDINVQGNNLILNQDMLFNINDSKLYSRSKISCNNHYDKKKCEISLQNINLNNFVNFFDSSHDYYQYFNNISGIFDVYLNFDFNKKFEFERGQISIISPIGSFYLRKYFDEKIDFRNFIFKASFKDNFKEFSVDSFTTNFDKTEFMMSMLFNKEKDYRNIDLFFDAKKVPIKNLKQLWPNFLGEEGPRPWVLEHVLNGESPHAWAKMNIKYFDDLKKNSGLQTLSSEVQMDNILLEYDDYFPSVKNINGVAKFTEKDMVITVNSGKILNSNIKSGTIAIDFKQPEKSVSIVAETRGPFSDLFVHINKSDQKMIENNINSIIEDSYTDSVIKIKVPFENISFNTTSIIVDTSLHNKKNSLLKNSANILLSFVKPTNSDSFFGKVDLTKSDIGFLPLNIYKPNGEDLIFNYGAYLADGIVYITEFKSLADYLSFNANGFIDIDKNIQRININNIKYNNSNYNVRYNSYVEKDKIFNNINIDGENINYGYLMDKIKKIDFTESESKNVNNELIVNLKLNSLDFLNEDKLYNPVLYVKFENNKLNSLNFKADMGNKKDVNVSLNKKTNMFNIRSKDFGKFFSTIELTDKINGGNGELNINKKTVNGKSVIAGNLDIYEKFLLNPDEKIKQDVLSNVEEDKNFKDLRKGLNKKSGIVFDRLRGDFIYSDNILNFEEVVVNSKYINLHILASGFINLETEKIDIQGLLVPLSIINGLFGVNKLPLVSDIIFGQKNAGLFASRFTVKKENANSELDIDINKFSMILPGFLRNIFSR